MSILMLCSTNAESIKHGCTPLNKCIEHLLLTAASHFAFYLFLCLATLLHTKIFWPRTIPDISSQIMYYAMSMEVRVTSVLKSTVASDSSLNNFSRRYCFIGTYTKCKCFIYIENY